MQSLGAIIASANTDLAPTSAQAAAGATEPRLHRVTLACHVFAEIEVLAATPEEAFAAAEAQSGAARRTFRSTPLAVRASIQRRVDARDPSKGLKWVRLERTVDADTGRVTWSPGGDDRT